MKHMLYLALSALLVVGMAALPAKAQTSGQMVVIKASGVALQEGQVIDGHQVLRLDSGSSVTLIGSNGSTVTLTGPYQQAPASGMAGQAEDPNIVKALGKLISGRKYSTASLGVVRSATAQTGIAHLDDPWMVSVESSGARCIRPGIVVLWREDSSNKSMVTISRSSAGLTAQADWAAGDNVLPLASERFRDGGTYKLDVDGNKVAFTVYVLPEEYSEPGQQAAWMVQSGCTNQALALVDGIG